MLLVFVIVQITVIMNYNIKNFYCDVIINGDIISSHCDIINLQCVIINFYFIIINFDIKSLDEIDKFLK